MKDGRMAISIQPRLIRVRVSATGWTLSDLLRFRVTVRVRVRVRVRARVWVRVRARVRVRVGVRQHLEAVAARPAPLAPRVARGDAQLGRPARAAAAQPLAVQRAVRGARGRRVDDGRRVAIPG